MRPGMSSFEFHKLQTPRNGTTERPALEIAHKSGVCRFE
jgi:hypothetical protein